MTSPKPWPFQPHTAGKAIIRHDEEGFNTLNITVNLIATFKALAGKSSLVLQPENGQSITDAFFQVLQAVPALKPHWLDQDGQPHIYVHVFLNGDDVSTLADGMSTRLSDGDVLDFIPPVAGG